MRRQARESVRILLRCEAKETLADAKPQVQKNPEAYLLEYVEDCFGPKTTQMPVDCLPQ